MSVEVPIETLAPAVAPPSIQPLRVGPYSLDLNNCTVRVEGVTLAFLTRFEMALLMHLASRPGILVGKEELTRLMYNGQRRPESNGLEVFVGRIRRKIDPDKTHKPLQTVRYSGYRFRNDWEPARDVAT